MKNAGVSHVGSYVDLSKELRFSIKDGTIEVPDFPTATHIGALKSPAAHRLSEMALHEHGLIEAEMAVSLLRQLPSEPDNQAVIRMLWTAAVTTYTRSFANHDDKLDARAIHGNNEVALGAHEYVWALRSKHFAHDVNDRRRSIAGALIDGDGAYLGLAQWQGLTQFQQGELDNLTKLVADALVYVRQERVRLEEVIDAEVRAMTPEQRLALPEPVLPGATPDTVIKSRRNDR
jgi:hypothetical protein